MARQPQPVWSDNFVQRFGQSNEARRLLSAVLLVHAEYAQANEIARVVALAAGKVENQSGRHAAQR